MFLLVFMLLYFTSVRFSASFYQHPLATFHGHVMDVVSLISCPPLINLHSPKHNRLTGVG